MSQFLKMEVCCMRMCPDITVWKVNFRVQCFILQLAVGLFFKKNFFWLKLTIQGSDGKALLSVESLLLQILKSNVNYFDPSTTHQSMNQQRSAGHPRVWLITRAKLTFSSIPCLPWRNWLTFSHLTLLLFELRTDVHRIGWKSYELSHMKSHVLMCLA